ncbi:SDR family NAD(P)-dependent oxidoreductase [Paenibacillus glucanolyticus]|uniref:type I polyketide synthase n=1 Tax=Paenibacillus glucanolyticus TaxID=59843 RepID=UPI0036C0C7DB
MNEFKKIMGLMELAKDEAIEIESRSNRDIAIIGISCKIAKANGTKEYWEILRNGEDCIRPLPDVRKAVNDRFLSHMLIPDDWRTYYDGGFLDEIDKFDYELFSISPREASLMSPNQRLFLESALGSIEDAGYGGKRIRGSKTGVFLGHSTDFGESYKNIIDAVDPSLSSLAIPGNINSIIASRISYLFDLKGPSIVVDTACSSSLAAVHLACQALRNHECEMAIAGSVKVDILPLTSIKQKEDELGITSSDGRTRSFDNNSEGTGLGEGVISIFLKPLDRAKSDRDHIYAVIKGSAMNQDGNSVGLTAPNSAAQEGVIVSAWQDAGVNPETIAYIEVHGTGTKLGDPIEISGIQRAFEKYTSKKQCCGIGSVKSNIGHLDNAAGLAGLVKAVLCLKNKELPPSLHFKMPNRKINFVNSPIYVNDTLRRWETNDYPRRCGVSAFGLSGTNCHIVLEEAPVSEFTQEVSDELHIFTLSAKNKTVLRETARRYVEAMLETPNVRLQDVCYTVNTGREQFACRLAVLCRSIQELREKLCQFSINDMDEFYGDWAFYGSHKLVSKGREQRTAEELTQEQKAVLTERANEILSNRSEIQNYHQTLSSLGQLFVAGAEINWSALYKKGEFRKQSLPGYSFKHTSVWIDGPGPLKKRNVESDVTALQTTLLHPLLGRLIVNSLDRTIYENIFTVDEHWVLHEHIVNGLYIVPGTVYIELITEAARRSFPDKVPQLKNVIFVSPLIVYKGEQKEVHTIIKSDGNHLEFVIASKSKDQSVWNTHAEGKLMLEDVSDRPNYSIDELKRKCSGGSLLTYNYQRGKGIETGSRWDCVSEIYCGKDEYLAYFRIRREYEAEVEQYNLHPALLDEAVNVGLRSVSEDLYLPYTYGSMTVFNKLPHSFYSYIRRQPSSQKSQREVATFEILLLDERGNSIAKIEDYAIKKAKDEALRRKDSIVYEMGWEQTDKVLTEHVPVPGAIAVFMGSTSVSSMLLERMKEHGKTVIGIDLGQQYEKRSEEHYIIDGSEDNYIKLFQEIKDKGITQIIHLQSVVEQERIGDVLDLEEHLQRGVHSLFFIARAILKAKWMNSVDFVIVAEHANEVTGNETQIYPHNAALFGLSKVIVLEFPKIRCRCIDIEPNISLQQIENEITQNTGTPMVALRNGQRFISTLGRVSLEDKNDRPIEIKDGGVYVITGGLGGLGLEFGKYLSSKNRVNLALISRTQMPDSAEWDAIVRGGSDKNLIRKIRTIREIERSGSKVDCFGLDLNDSSRTKEALESIKSKYGRIDGIIHGAGIAGDGFMITKNHDTFCQVMSPKIQGTWILDRLTEDEDLDFFVLFSSITSVSAEVGQGDYTAANSYLDSYASYRAKMGKRTIAINWPAWNEVGMAVDYNVDMDGDIFHSIGTEQALRAFEEVMRKDTHRVILGRVNDEQLKKHINQLPFRFKGSMIPSSEDSNKDDNNTGHPLRGSRQSKLEPLNNQNIESKLKHIWCGVLSMQEIDVYESFYDMGGDSILATHLWKELNKEFPDVIDITDIFTHSSIMEMSQYIKNKLEPKKVLSAPAKEETDMDTLLEKLINGEITEAQIDEMM